MSKVAKDKPTLAQQMQQLDDTLAWFEQPNIDIDEAYKKYEQGIALAESIQEQLTAMQNKVTILRQKFDQDA